MVVEYCCCSVAQSCLTLCNQMDYSTPGFPAFTISWNLLKLMSIESVMASNHLILCHSLLLLPSVFLSIRVFSNESAFHIRWPKYWSFRFSISPSNEYSGLISFRIDWFDLLTAQGTLKSLLQHHRNTDGPYLRRNRHGSPKRLDPEHLATVLAKIPLYSLPFVA